MQIRAGHVRLRTLAVIRWVAIAGQAGALLVVQFGLGFNLPLEPALAIVGASALLNLVITFERPIGTRIGDRAAAWFLGYDTLQLTALLYLTGGLENPFSLLLLAPVVVSATILSARSTIALCALVLTAITVLAVWHRPLPWAEGNPVLPPTYVLGSWVALALGIVFFALYTWRVAEEARRMSEALSAAHLALAREQQFSALGALAAAAAHELGSPLSTIAVAAREIARDLPADNPIAEDVRLLRSEADRCRNILAELAMSPYGEGGGAFDAIPVDALAEEAAARYDSERVDIDVRCDGGPAPGSEKVPMPLTAPRPEILHGLGNLIQNAIQFARSLVIVMTRWSAEEITITITDDGPGFPAGVLHRLGEPYLSVRERRSVEAQHMGLGIFIAQTLLQRTGAEIAFANREGRGAEIVVRWPRASLETAVAIEPRRSEGGRA